MEAFWILNGAADEKLYRNIEKYGMLKGFLTYRPQPAEEDRKQSLQTQKETEEQRFSRTCLVYADQKGYYLYRDKISRLHKAGCPVILVPSSKREMQEIRRHSRKASAWTSYPFSFSEFRKTADRYLNPEVKKKRDLYYGERLWIERSGHLIVFRDRKIQLGPYEFDILVYILEKIGTAVSREEINQILPFRKRESTRNVDTHIKNIRRILDMQDVIISVRAVGYRVDTDKFYRECVK